jgi:hypothetical protein
MYGIEQLKINGKRIRREKKRTKRHFIIESGKGDKANKLRTIRNGIRAGY